MASYRKDEKEKLRRLRESGSSAAPSTSSRQLITEKSAEMAVAIKDPRFIAMHEKANTFALRRDPVLFFTEVY